MMVDWLEQGDFSSIRHPALSFCLSMIFSENRPPLFRIMLWCAGVHDASVMGRKPTLRVRDSGALAARSGICRDRLGWMENS
jgi:hypothetical protein